MDTLTQDLRYALRRLLRSPGFTLIAVLTLALGIGANSAIFSVVHGVLLRPLPFAEPDRLVMLYTGYPDDETRYPLSPPDFMSFHDDARAFSGVAAVSPSEETLTGRGEPERVPIAMVSRRFFEVMGVSPVLGRSFHEEESEPGANEVTVLGHAFWRQHFGADPRVIGQTLTLSGVQRTVVGVLPPEFDFPDQRALYYPIAYDSRFNSTTAQARRGEFLTTVARLAPGVTVEQALTEARTINARLQQEFPQTNSQNINLTLLPLREQLMGSVRAPLLILLGAVGLVLLIACANVANLLLARAAAREGEMAVRTALGAGRGRIVRQLLTESVLLGLAGGAAGLLLAVFGTHALLAARPEGIPRLEGVGVDATVVAFTMLIAVGTGLLFGLIPAVQATRSDLALRIREGGRGGLGGRASNRARRTLVVTEIALALMLVVGAGLLIRSFAQLTAVDPGFRTERLVSFGLSTPPSAYEDGAAVRQFYERLLERVASLPGVESAAAAANLPLAGTRNILGFDIENREPPPPGFVQDAALTSVTPEYFSTLGIPLRRGRLLEGRDGVDAPEVVVVNEAFVRRYLPGEDPIGRRISLNGEEWIEIVGVVGDAPQYGLDQDVRPAMFATLSQFTTRTLTVVARTAGDPLALAGAIRREVAALDPNLPVQRFTTGEQLVSASVAQPRFYMALLAIFAGVALLLAAVGIFGVMSYLVTQRTREIGVRMALGANPASVLRLVVGGALGLAGVGVAVGVLAALLGSRLLSGLLFGVGSLDPVTYVGAAAVLLAVAALASYLPARAATRVDPNTALRFD
jgi:putative ABC transport system permease protein